MDSPLPPERLSDKLLRERRQRERKITRSVAKVMLIIAATMSLEGGAYALVLVLGGPAWTGDLLVPIGTLLMLAFLMKWHGRTGRKTSLPRRGPARERRGTRDEF